MWRFGLHATSILVLTLLQNRSTSAPAIRSFIMHSATAILFAFATSILAAPMPHPAAPKVNDVIRNPTPILQLPEIDVPGIISIPGIDLLHIGSRGIPKVENVAGEIGPVTGRTVPAVGAGIENPVIPRPDDIE
jgi:hypothetical protein